jgi:hypothetical protein
LRVQVLQQKRLHRRENGTATDSNNKDQVNEAMNGTTGQTVKPQVLTWHSKLIISSKKVQWTVP